LRGGGEEKGVIQGKKGKSPGLVKKGRTPNTPEKVEGKDLCAEKEVLISRDTGEVSSGGVRKRTL